jgi:uncharacterized protein YbjT (DUF2867 family)
MAILVTDGTGLVGSRLLQRFVDADVDCRARTNRRTVSFRHGQRQS